MYNVKILKYPSGWQYRVYNQVVGFHGSERHDYREKAFEEDLIWDVETKQYIHLSFIPRNMWENIFTGQFEPKPKEIVEPDLERSLLVSVNRTINKVYHLARSNIWDWFITLTFDPDKVDSFDYAACTKALHEWLRNMRRLAPDLAYLLVPELHKSGRFHFHGLFASCGSIKFIESGHFTKSGDVIYNVGNYRLGFTTATRIKKAENVTKYIGKYISKDLCAVSRGKKRYWASRNLVECESEELILDYDKLHTLLDRLESECSHRKILTYGELTTTYYEMGAME